MLVTRPPADTMRKMTCSVVPESVNEEASIGSKTPGSCTRRFEGSSVLNRFEGSGVLVRERSGSIGKNIKVTEVKLIKSSANSSEHPDKETTPKEQSVAEVIQFSPGRQPDPRSRDGSRANSQLRIYQDGAPGKRVLDRSGQAISSPVTGRCSSVASEERHRQHYLNQKN